MKQLNMNDLREILGDEIRKIREGKTTAANANAVSNATGKILATVRLELKYAEMTGKSPAIKLLN